MDIVLVQGQNTLDLVLELPDMVAVVAASENYFLDAAVEVEADEEIVVFAEIAERHNQ
jgi:hypothetical protein